LRPYPFKFWYYYFRIVKFNIMKNLTKIKKKISKNQFFSIKWLKKLKKYLK